MISDFHALCYSNHACILTTSGRYLTISSVIFFLESIFVWAVLHRHLLYWWLWRQMNSFTRQPDRNLNVYVLSAISMKHMSMHVLRVTSILPDNHLLSTLVDFIHCWEQTVNKRFSFRSAKTSYYKCWTVHRAYNSNLVMLPLLWLLYFISMHTLF